MLLLLAGCPSFYGRVNTLCIKCISHIFYIHSSVKGHSGYCHLFPVAKNSAMGMDMQASLSDPVSVPLDISPEVGMLDHTAVLFLILLDHYI